jgi:molybdopterin biosynthesis enzyme
MEDATTVIQKRRSTGLSGTISGVIEVKEMRRPKAGAVITGNEIFYGRIKDVFAPIITEKIRALNGEMVGISYAPDKEEVIEERLRELLRSGADLLITTGGMSVDPDDVTRFAIRNLGAHDISYGAAVLPGAMFLVASLNHQESGSIPILGIPACAMYHRITVLDLILPRILAGEKIGRRELAELGHGGLCLNCRECRFPVCPFGK